VSCSPLKLVRTASRTCRVERPGLDVARVLWLLFLVWASARRGISREPPAEGADSHRQGAALDTEWLCNTTLGDVAEQWALPTHHDVPDPRLPEGCMTMSQPVRTPAGLRRRFFCRPWSLPPPSP
jgi:hypothetical protein